jgi:hypothetical protein
MSEATMTLAEADAHVRSATADLQQRLETALQCVSTLRGDIDDLTRKLTEASRERDEAQANYRFMVERAADQRLDGYRELGQRAATAENERDEARAQLATLRAEAAATVEEARRQGIDACIAELENLAITFESGADRDTAKTIRDVLVPEVRKRTGSRPSLEGHPAWEAFERAPIDAEPVSEAETAAVAMARAGAFTREVTSVAIAASEARGAEAERAAVVATGRAWIADARSAIRNMPDVDREIATINGLERFIGEVEAGRHVAREEG